MLGRQESKKANNAWFGDAEMRRWAVIGSQLPINKSDPHFAARTFLHLRKNLLDFVDFRTDVCSITKSLSEESRKAMRETLARMDVFFADDEISMNSQKAAA